MLYATTGTFRYFKKEGYKLIVEVDQELSDYYRSLIPRYKDVNHQRYGAHISVVRREIPVNLEFWGKYEGQEVEFVYDSEVKWGRVYYWLNTFSEKLEKVRTELGLPVSTEYTRPPEGFVKCFHMTLANVKHLGVG